MWPETLLKERSSHKCLPVDQQIYQNTFLAELLQAYYICSLLFSNIPIIVFNMSNLRPNWRRLSVCNKTLFRQNAYLRKWISNKHIMVESTLFQRWYLVENESLGKKAVWNWHETFPIFWRKIITNSYEISQVFTIIKAFRKKN